MSKIYEANQFIKTSGTGSQYLMADGTTSTGPSGGVDVGTGTANKIPKFSDSDTITDGIMTDDGTSVFVDGNLAIGTVNNDYLFNIDAEDNVYDISRAISIDYTKDHTGTGWDAGIWGVKVNLYADGTGKNANVQGGSFSSEHIGSGVSYYLLGSQSLATHNGTGDSGVMWGAFNKAEVKGTGTATHPWLIGTNQTAYINNANASVASMHGILASAKTNAGDVTGRMDAAWLTIDGNQGSTTVVDANLLYLNAQLGNITASGTIRAIHSDTTLPSLFLGTMETTSFIKTGGTSSQFLKADGSVDTNTYLTGTLPTDFVSAASGGTFSGSLTISSDTDTIFKLNNSDNGPQYITYARSNDRHAYVGFAGSSDNFTIMSEETAGQIILGTAATTRMTIDSDGNVGIGVNNPSYKLDVWGDGIALGSAAFAQYDSSNDLFLVGDWDGAGADMAIYDGNSSEVVRIKNGKVGIGETDPSHKLDINQGELRISNNQLDPKIILQGDDMGGRWVLGQDEEDNIGSTGFYIAEGASVDATNALLYLTPSGRLGIGTTNAGEKLEVNGNAKADSFIVDGGTSSQFLKADGSVDSTTYTTGSHPTDFVSAAGGGTFSGDVTADAFIVPGGSSGRFLKADGSVDSTAYLSGLGTSGHIPIYDSASVLIDNSDLTFNFLTSKVTMGADLDVVGDIETANVITGDITADTWTYIPQTFQSNFVHTGGNSYVNVPFNSLSDGTSGGEQHFIVTPYAGYVHTVAFKNTATGTAMTGTNMNFRVLVNGVTVYTSSTQTFTAAARTFKGWTLSSTDALFDIGHDLRFQFRCTSGLWQDTCAVVVLKGLI